MTLLELKNKIDSILAMHGDTERVQNLQVVIITSENSMGGRACSTLQYAHRGIDWESGRFNLTAEHDLFKANSKTRDQIYEEERIKFFQTIFHNVSQGILKIHRYGYKLTIEETNRIKEAINNSNYTFKKRAYNGFIQLIDSITIK